MRNLLYLIAGGLAGFDFGGDDGEAGDEQPTTGNPKEREGEK